MGVLSREEFLGGVIMPADLRQLAVEHAAVNVMRFSVGGQLHLLVRNQSGQDLGGS
jgi:hypothetical protein